MDTALKIPAAMLGIYHKETPDSNQRQEVVANLAGFLFAGVFWGALYLSALRRADTLPLWKVRYGVTLTSDLVIGGVDAAATELLPNNDYSDFISRTGVCGALRVSILAGTVYNCALSPSLLEYKLAAFLPLIAPMAASINREVFSA